MTQSLTSSQVFPPTPPNEKDVINTTTELTRAGTQNTLEKTFTAPHDGRLSASNINMTRSTSTRTVPAPNSPEVWSQKVVTDHMLTCRWTAESGWETPEIRPYGPLNIMPTASCLHYATECFEGMKAYRGDDGKMRIFRPERNTARMLKSATRIALPGFEPEQLQSLIENLVAVDSPKWLPVQTHKGQYLYIRPSMVGLGEMIGVQVPTEALLFVVMVCFPPLDEAQSGRGMKLLASKHDMVRAWPGGFGNAKVGANYGPSLVASQEAKERGFSQILWLFGEEGYVTEVGAANFFVVWKTREGKTQMVTAPLGDGIILEGVTRQSVLDIAREKLEGEVEVVEKRFTMQDIADAYEEGRLIEAFGSGTAFFIAAVEEIEFRGKSIKLPLAKGTPSKYAMSIKAWLKDIMFGRTQHEWGVVVDEEE